MTLNYSPTGSFDFSKSFHFTSFSQAYCGSFVTFFTSTGLFYEPLSFFATSRVKSTSALTNRPL
jgi:hypothetical protein